MSNLAAFLIALFILETGASLLMAFALLAIAFHECGWGKRRRRRG